MSAWASVQPTERAEPAPAKAGIQGGKGRVLRRIRLDRRLPPGRRHRPHGGRKRDTGMDSRFRGNDEGGGAGTLAPGRPSARGGYAKGFVTRSFAEMTGLVLTAAPRIRHSRESGNPGRERTGLWAYPPRPTASPGPSSQVPRPHGGRKRDTGMDPLSRKGRGLY